jgi:hypothetical protein
VGFNDGLTICRIFQGKIITLSTVFSIPSMERLYHFISLFVGGIKRDRNIFDPFDLKVATEKIVKNESVE